VQPHFPPRVNPTSFRAGRRVESAVGPVLEAGHHNVLCHVTSQFAASMWMVVSTLVTVWLGRGRLSGHPPGYQHPSREALLGYCRHLTLGSLNPHDALRYSRAPASWWTTCLASASNIRPSNPTKPSSIVSETVASWGDPGEGLPFDLHCSLSSLRGMSWLHLASPVCLFKSFLGGAREG